MFETANKVTDLLTPYVQAARSASRRCVISIVLIRDDSAWLIPPCSCFSASAVKVQSILTRRMTYHRP